MTIRFSALLLLLPGTSVATAQTAPEGDNLLPPELPWRGKSERLVAKADDPWITPSEKDEFVSTPDYATTRAWLDRLVASSERLRIESYGTSVLGRELYAVIATKDGARPAKPLVLVQAGIHPGEIDGKDAGLMLLRDIALRGKETLLDGVTLCSCPFSVRTAMRTPSPTAARISADRSVKAGERPLRTST